MSKTHENTRSRRVALQVLYQADILGVPADKALEEAAVPDEAVIDVYAHNLVLGVAGHQAEIDAAISRVSKNWALDRMPVVDRCVLRLAVFEMLHVDVPISVSINEAVELAKQFGGEDDSHRFVNGVLGRLAREIDGTYVPEISEDEMTDIPEAETVESEYVAADGLFDSLSDAE